MRFRGLFGQPSHRRRPTALALEELEVRAVPAAIDLTINGDQFADTNDTVTISQDAAGGIRVSLDGQVTNYDPPTAIRSITVNGLTGTNTLTLDFGGGNFLSLMNPDGDTLPDGLIHFDAGDGGKLILQGGGFTNETDVAAAAGDGTITLDGGAVTYVNVSPHTVIDTVPVATYAFEDPNSFDGINVVNGPTQNGFATTAITSTTDQFVEHDLANKASLFVADTSADGGALFTVNNPTPASGLQVLTVVTATSGFGSTTNVLATAAGVTTDVVGGAADTVAVGNNHSVQGIAGRLNVENPPNINFLILDDAADPVGRSVTLGTLGANPDDVEGNADPWGLVHGLAPADIRYEYGDNNPVFLEGGTGGNSFVLTALPAAGTEIDIDGGAGANRLTAPNVPNLWVLTGPNSGNLDGPFTVNFARVGSLVGGTDHDTFEFLAGGSEGAINGGGGFDAIAGPPNRTNVFAVTGANSGHIAGVLGSFVNVPYLLGNGDAGNTGTDVFQFYRGGHLSGQVEGGTGSEWLDYTPLTTPVRVNLAARTATGIAAGVTHLPAVPMNVLGSGVGGDVLVGDATGSLLLGHNGGNTIVAGGGRTVIIGGYGKNTLQGGAGDALIIAGSTAFDQSVAALGGLLAEWRGAKPFATRVADLRTGGGLTGGHALVLGRTVYLPPTVPGPRFGRGGGSNQSTLVGGTGQDWFFTLYPTAIVNRKNGDLVD